MFAIIKTGGKQYRVEKDKNIIVDKVAGNVGDSFTFDEVLMIDDKIGEPTLKGAAVVAKILAQKKDDKVIVFKKKRRQNYRRFKGHRQEITILKVTDIKA